MSVSINGTNGLTFSDASTQSTAATGFGFKNRLINSAMMIDQRNAGASVNNAASSNTFTVDRFAIYGDFASKVSGQRSTTAPAGFTNSLLLTSLAATTVGANDFYGFRQNIEGFNIADLGWGTANAQPVTLSFWVRSSLTGTFAVSFGNNAANRAYVATYVINAANTFEYKTITISGDTTGTWLTDNSTGIGLWWDLGSGSNRAITANSWSGTYGVRTSGSTSLVATNGATFYITGVQLEKGSTATSFDYRPYGTELALCQRYFETSFNGAALASNTDNGGVIAFNGSAGSTTTSFIGQAVAQYRVTKRTAPTITLFDLAIPRNSGALTRYQLGVSNNNNQNATLSDNGTSGFTVYSTGSAGASGIVFHYTSSAEL